MALQWMVLDEGSACFHIGRTNEQGDIEYLTYQENGVTHKYEWGLRSVAARMADRMNREAAP